MLSTETKLNKNQVVKNSFPVMGMSCASCASSVESILNQTNGISQASVNFANHTAYIEYEKGLSPKSFQQAIQAIGFDLILDEENAASIQDSHQQKYVKDLKIRTLWSAIFAFPIFVLGMFFMDWPFSPWISMVLSIPVLGWFGRNFFIQAWKQAKYGKANMDTLVALSTGVAFLFSLFNTLFPEFWLSRGLQPHVYYEAAVVIITFISFGKLLEEKAKASTSSAIKKLMGLQPKSLHAMIDGQEVEIPIASVKKGYEIIVRPGEQIPVDGEIISGNSYIDESMISGEAIAVEKKPGNKVFAGTINQKGSFNFISEKVGSETLLAQIILKVQEAQGSKAPVQKLVDKIAAIFVPIVIGISIMTFIVWMLVGGENAFTHALLTSVAVLVIACPCALGLATPTAIMVGIGKGAENNMLIKDAESLEIAQKVNAIVLDKTGTITEGKPTLTDILWDDGIEVKPFQSILLAIELRSDHPLAEAVVTQLKQQQISPVFIQAIHNVSGKGILAKDEAGMQYLAGNKQLLLDHHIAISENLSTQALAWQEEAKTIVYFANQNKVLAILALVDKVKSTSRQAIKSIQDQAIDVYMLTGDNQQTAQAVAKQVGIKHFFAETLPDDKAKFITQLQSQGKTVAMVGDGINDSQALALADMSIAMGKGSDIAMDVAKITLISSDLNSLPKVLKLSKKTVRGIKQNLFWAFFYNIIGIPIAAGILYPINGFLLDPMIAGAAMALSSVSVVANSLRLKASTL